MSLRIPLWTLKDTSPQYRNTLTFRRPSGCAPCHLGFAIISILQQVPGITDQIAQACLAKLSLPAARFISAFHCAIEAPDFERLDAPPDGSRVETRKAIPRQKIKFKKPKLVYEAIAQINAREKVSWEQEKGLSEDEAQFTTGVVAALVSSPFGNAIHLLIKPGTATFNNERRGSNHTDVDLDMLGMSLF